MTRFWRRPPAASLPSPRDFPIVIRRVWNYNFAEEFDLIAKFMQYYPCASFDTEFPGTVYQAADHRIPTELYAAMKKNVDAMKIIQLGLTLSDWRGNLPHDMGHQYVWEFNFRDFDEDVDLKNPDSISLLRRQGIAFATNRHLGIDSSDFGAALMSSGILAHRIWVTFHGLYDLGYLIKILTGKELPDEIGGFIDQVKEHLGGMVFDLKTILRAMGVHGGLDKAAATLGVNRGAGMSHQAGSDSLVTMHAFLNVIHRSPSPQMAALLQSCNHKLYGCEFSNCFL